MNPPPVIEIPQLPEGGSAEVGEAEWSNRKASAQARRAAEARHLSGRRQLVDPATCDRHYSAEELEFMQAMQDYKKSSGRNFPTWSEVLEVLRHLGYTKSVTSSDESLAADNGPAQASQAG